VEDEEGIYVPDSNKVRAIGSALGFAGKSLPPECQDYLSNMESILVGKNHLDLPPDLTAEKLDAMATAIFGFSARLDAFTLVVAWKKGDLLLAMHTMFKVRKDEIKRLGLRLADEKLTWTGWLAKKRVARNVAGRLIHVRKHWGIEQLATQKLGELYGQDSPDYEEDIPQVGTTVLAQDQGVTLYVDGTRRDLIQGTCFKVTQEPQGEGKNWNPTVEILTGQFRGKQVEMPISDYREMVAIAAEDVREPEVKPAKVKKESHTTKTTKVTTSTTIKTEQPKLKPKPKPDGVYVTTKEVSGLIVPKGTTLTTPTLAVPKGTYLIGPRQAGSLTEFMIFTGAQHREMVTLPTAELSKTLNPSSWDVIARRWYEQEMPTPDWGDRKDRQELVKLLEQAAALAKKLGQLNSQESAFVRYNMKQVSEIMSIS
jgi:hypothetical protein